MAESILTIYDEIKTLLVDYLLANPEGDNPYDLIYLLGPDEVLRLLKEANNREIRFSFDPEKDDFFEYEIIEIGNE